MPAEAFCRELFSFASGGHLLPLFNRICQFCVLTNNRHRVSNSSRYGFRTSNTVLSQRDDCTRQRQTCCETGTQSRESLARSLRVSWADLKKTVWLPKAIGEIRFSVHSVLLTRIKRYDSGKFAVPPAHKLDQPLNQLRKSSRTKRQLQPGRVALRVTSPSFLFSPSHSSFLNSRCIRLREASPCPILVALRVSEGPHGPTQIPLTAQLARVSSSYLHSNLAAGLSPKFQLALLDPSATIERGLVHA